ncbi:unnamed protein product [Pieris macdunnoughi]|uniref:Uncharacterized protein n=1 Tax=Pieris macdunnoughi TaxID=345717 RepID=A0A821UM11_9NEOP|nr:unnamed protein product [Pieris macdunnoughi]
MTRFVTLIHTMNECLKHLVRFSSIEISQMITLGSKQNARQFYAAPPF